MAEIQLAAAIVIHRGFVLLVRRSLSEKLAPGVWGVPCGKIDKGESPTEAVLRELREETGLNGEIVGFAETREFKSKWRGRWIVNLQWNYLVEPAVDPMDTDASDMPQIRPPKADQKSRWVPADKIDSVDGLDNHNLETIRQGLAALAER